MTVCIERTAQWMLTGGRAELHPSDRGTHAGSISAVADRSPALKASYRLMTLLIKSLINNSRSEYAGIANLVSWLRSSRCYRMMRKTAGTLPIASGLDSALSAIHFCSFG